MVVQRKKKQYIDKKTNQIVKILNHSKKGSITEKTYKPRYGFSVRCPICNWTRRAGGILEQKEAVQREIATIKEHRILHKKLHGGKQSSSDPDIGLQVKRSHHAAEITHFFDEQASRQTTTSTSYTDVPGAFITNGLTANQDNLVIVTAQMDMSTTGDVGSLRMMRGTTAIADSEMSMEPNAVSDRMAYNWYGVINAGATETIKMQFRASAATVGVDLITITVVKLSPDLQPNVDYKYSLDSDSTSFATLEADLTTNNAQIIHTPGTGGHRWLIFGKSRVGTGISSLTAVSSRIEHTGGGTSSYPEARREGEDNTLDNYIQMTMRVDTLTAASHTYTEITRLMASGTGAAASGARTHSGIFMMDLDKFRTVSPYVQEDNTQELPINTTAYAETVATISITPSVAGDILALGYTTMDAGGSGFTYKMRMQIDNTDPQDIPSPVSDDVTAKSYNLVQHDTADRIPLLYSYIEDLSTATHTIDIDGSVTNSAGSEGTLDRSLIAFSMELEGGVARTMVINDTMTINESMLTTKGVQRIFLQNDTMTITEQFLSGSSGSSVLIQPSNFVMMLSGGTTNTDPNLSLGGPMSTVTEGTPGTLVTADYEPTDYEIEDYETQDRVIGGGEIGVVTDITALWDPVNQTESEISDTEYRLIYITNTHPSLTMYDVTLWIPENTPAADDIRIGAGAAASNADEPAVFDENTAPGTVTFPDAHSWETGVHTGDLPPGHKKGVWFRRHVPAGTPAREANAYLVSGRFYSNAVPPP